METDNCKLSLVGMRAFKCNIVVHTWEQKEC